MGVKIYRRLVDTYRALKLKIEFRNYDEYTICDYFRKQGAQIGKDCRIYIQNLGSEPYLIKIGNHCTISPHVRFVTHNGAAWIFRREIPNIQYFGKIEIKDNSFIGINSIILPDVTIGNNCVVSAGSLISNDVPDDCIVAGVPARIIGKVEDFKKKCIERWETLNLSKERKYWRKELTEFFWQNKTEK